MLVQPMHEAPQPDRQDKVSVHVNISVQSILHALGDPEMDADGQPHYAVKISDLAAMLAQSQPEPQDEQDRLYVQLLQKFAQEHDTELPPGIIIPGGQADAQSGILVLDADGLNELNSMLKGGQWSGLDIPAEAFGPLPTATAWSPEPGRLEQELQKGKLLSQELFSQENSRGASFSKMHHVVMEARSSEKTERSRNLWQKLSKEEQWELRGSVFPFSGLTDFESDAVRDFLDEALSTTLEVIELTSITVLVIYLFIQRKKSKGASREEAETGPSTLVNTQGGASFTAPVTVTEGDFVAGDKIIVNIHNHPVPLEDIDLQVVTNLPTDGLVKPILVVQDKATKQYYWYACSNKYLGPEDLPAIRAQLAQKNPQPDPAELTRGIHYLTLISPGGNSLVEELRPLLRNADESVRLTTVHALGEKATQEAVQILSERLDTETSPMVVDGILRTLLKSGQDQAVDRAMLYLAGKQP